MLFIRFERSDALNNRVRVKDGPSVYIYGPLDEVNFDPTGDVLDGNGKEIAYQNLQHDYIVIIDGKPVSFSDICIYSKGK